jgi:AmiR/NasT family two-component response regulator
MADTYRITPHGPEFMVTLNAGAAVQLYSTQEEAIRGIKECEQDDLLLVTARRLVEKAINVMMRTHHMNRRAAYGWIREAAG